MATAFNPDFGLEGVADFALNDTDIFASGCYHALDGTLRPGLVSFSLATGVLNPWTPILGGGPEGNYSPEAVAISQRSLYAGGSVYIGRKTVAPLQNPHYLHAR